jgi:hypothetical protein
MNLIECNLRLSFPDRCTPLTEMDSVFRDLDMQWSIISNLTRVSPTDSDSLLEVFSCVNPLSAAAVEGDVASQSSKEESLPRLKRKNIEQLSFDHLPNEVSEQQQLLSPVSTTALKVQAAERRRLKNKISAQLSRNRKKREFERLKEENQRLQLRVEELEAENRALKNNSAIYCSEVDEMV